MKIFNIEWWGACYVVLLPLLLFLSIDSYIPRLVIEAGSIFLAAAFVMIKSKFNPLIILFVAYVFISRLLISGSLVISAYDLSAFGLLIYLTNFSVRFVEIKTLIFLVSLVEFSYGVYCFLVGNSVDGGRVGGLFPSSMHYGFATAALAIANFISPGNRKRYIVFIFLFGSSLLSGSRASTTCVTLMLMLALKDDFGLKKAAIFSTLASFAVVLVLGDFRALNYIEASDQVRINTYVDWIARLNVGDILFGKGRYYLGSVGVVNNGADSIVTESSVLNFIEAYGIFVALIFILSPVLKLFKCGMSLKIIAVVCGGHVFSDSRLS